MTISKKIYFEAIADNAIDMTVETEDGVITISANDIKAFAEKEIALLEKKSAQARERAAAKKSLPDELKVLIASLLTGEPQTADEIFSQVDGDDVTMAKVQHRLGKLASDGIATKAQISIKNEDGKTVKRMAYTKC